MPRLAIGREHIAKLISNCINYSRILRRTKLKNAITFLRPCRFSRALLEALRWLTRSAPDDAYWRAPWAKRFKRVIAFDVAPLTDAANWPSNLQHVVFRRHAH